MQAGNRHGWLASGKFKISFRFWVRGFSILLQDMPAMIKYMLRGHEQPFDLSVYSARRLLAVPGGCKGGGDTRKLNLIGYARPEECLAQNLVGDERELVIPDEVKTVALFGASKQPPPPEWSTVKEVLEAHGFGDPVFKGTREQSLTFTCDCLGKECRCCTHTHEKQNW